MQLDGIKDEFIAKAKEMHAQKEAMHAAFMAELRKEEINRENLKDLIDQKRAQIDEFINLAMDRLIEFHKTLSAEQREKLATKKHRVLATKSISKNGSRKLRVRGFRVTSCFQPRIIGFHF